MRQFRWRAASTLLSLTKRLYTTETVEQELHELSEEIQKSGSPVTDSWARRIDDCCQKLQSIRLGESRRWIRVADASELEAVLRGKTRADAVSAQDEGAVPSYLLTEPAYVLPTAPTTVQGSRRVDLFVEAGSRCTIVGSISVSKGAKLVLNGGIDVQATEGMPCIEVVGAQFKVCASADAPVVLRGGRDGVYLSGGGQCHLTHCHLCENGRGLFEGFRCQATLQNCRFTRNTFHCVLLGDRTRRHEDVISAFVSSENVHAPESEGTRGDFVFSYNPVLDTYEEVYKDGRVVVLSSNNTLGLSAPSW